MVLRSEVAKYKSTGSYLGIAIDLVCARHSTAASSATCWEIEVRNKKTNDGNRTRSTLPEGLRSPGSLFKSMGFVITAKYGQRRDLHWVSTTHEMMGPVSRYDNLRRTCSCVSLFRWTSERHTTGTSCAARSLTIDNRHGSYSRRLEI